MTTSASFEVATLADAVSKANRYAPKRGDAADKAGGLLLELPGEGMRAVIRSTDLVVFYRQEIALAGREHAHFEPVTWRIPNQLLEAIVSRLPMHMGAEVTLSTAEDKANLLNLRAGTIRATVHLYDPELSFPAWDAYDTEGMVVVEGMADRLSQVEWATEKKGDGILTGVHIDGEYLWATDRNAVARVPLRCEVDRPVTAPIQQVLSLVKTHPEVWVQVQDNRLNVMLDGDTQLSMLIFSEEWPNVSQFTRFEFPHSATVDRLAMIETVDRLSVVAQVDSKANENRAIPYVTMTFDGDSTLIMSMDVPDVGYISEELKVVGIDEFQMHVTPTYLKDALAGARKQEVTFSHMGDPVRPFKITDGLGYEAVVMPRKIR